GVVDRGNAEASEVGLAEVRHRLPAGFLPLVARVLAVPAAALRSQRGQRRVGADGLDVLAQEAHPVGGLVLAALTEQLLVAIHALQDCVLAGGNARSSFCTSGLKVSRPA